MNVALAVIAPEPPINDGYVRAAACAAPVSGERRTRSPRDDYQANYELAIVSDLIRHLRHYYITRLITR